VRSLINPGHGTAAAAGALLVAERPPLDETAPPNAADTAAGLAEATRRGRPFTRGNAAAKGKKPALCLLAVPLEACDPRYRAAMRQANAYRQRRCRETAVSCGGTLGAGPSAMFASSARALAASVVLNTLAGELLAAGDVKAASAMFATAARLGDSSRQQELTAVGLAERDRASRPRAPGERRPWELTDEEIAAAAASDEQVVTESSATPSSPQMEATS
jgi:hypothetical protein